MNAADAKAIEALVNLIFWGRIAYALCCRWHPALRRPTPKDRFIPLTDLREAETGTALPRRDPVLIVRTGADGTVRMRHVWIETAKYYSDSWSVLDGK